MLALIGKLPSCNYSLVGWLVRHFESVVANEQKPPCWVPSASCRLATTAWSGGWCAILRALWQRTGKHFINREATMLPLIGKLPSCNYSLVGWLVRHFESVVANEQVNTL
ncbi:Rlip [Operophtera brumata]|uniref:Rlip n=1 Tax=Operophtera brumata TaxID=104452 RepID=A0A0L7LJK7_OPEBR|nr:Rlip [Operophtera brumata]